MRDCGFVFVAGGSQLGGGSSRAVCEGRRDAQVVKRARTIVVRCAEKEETFDEVAARAAEIKEVIDGLKKFRQRIIDDTTALAKKIKAPQKKLKEALAKHPDILKIDSSLIELEKELNELGYGQ
ncbi:hypothetical protein NDN08_005525 [Rhodosorus marinus]|uniref:Uncharacterized protein n=1 Tax=Rhodosorus marinus TaxID=101924 RepID=A0AAV8V3Y9_9RHOD|nr:hypothetical protein NDN08_005525 [Rhodosorus marinus]